MALAALTRLTFADTVRQPVTWLMSGLSLGLIALSYWFGMFNFETQDRLRMLATAGVAVAIINGLFLGVMLASTTVHEELASRTALTLFAKPLKRSTFLIGKALGALLCVGVSAALIATAHFGTVAYATHRESVESHHHHDDHAHEGHIDDVWVVPWRSLAAAHILALAHSAVLVCIATALALRLPLAANIIACFAVFVLGHLLAGMKIMGGVVIPALALFNIDDTIQLPMQPISWQYVGGTVLYALMFAAGSLFLALAVFKRQDIT